MSGARNVKEYTLVFGRESINIATFTTFGWVATHGSAGCIRDSASNVGQKLANTASSAH